ncbi:MAG: hypothetical protein HGA45_24940 [Chloroflexales bacterium]|nr:hypothetical protein [Chloroflexales bacterium]
MAYFHADRCYYCELAQEALSNVQKHADATNVSIIIERRGDQVVLVVEDDGRGFDAEDVPADDEHTRDWGWWGCASGWRKSATL